MKTHGESPKYAGVLLKIDQLFFNFIFYRKIIPRSKSRFESFLKLPCQNEESAFKKVGNYP